MTALAARRRHPLALILFIACGLFTTGAVYSLVVPRTAQGSATNSQDIAEGKKLFLSNCATCHGLNAQGASDGTGGLVGPNLIGVGAAAVDFQVSSGRMPAAAPGPQVQAVTKGRYSETEVRQLAAYVASLAPGPAIPDAQALDSSGGNAARGGAIFRSNCAMCHNFAGAGGALTRGKVAPPLTNTSDKHIYEAMITGPQSMPVFNDANISPQSKKDILAYLNTVQEEPNASGSTLGNLGPVPEGLFVWIVGIGSLIGCAIWLGAKAA